MASAARARSTQQSPCPSKLGDEKEHFWLIQRMAKDCEIDLAAAMADGRLDQQTWADMVARCRGCAWAEGCHDWLDAVELATFSAQENAQQDAPAAPPSPCLNRNRLADLKTGSD